MAMPLPPQAPSEYEANPELLFYRITHLNRGQQYLIWAAAVTTAGRGNISEKVTVEPAGKGESASVLQRRSVDWMIRDMADQGRERAKQSGSF